MITIVTIIQKTKMLNIYYPNPNPNPNPKQKFFFIILIKININQYDKKILILK
jgi:hypothetical protein